MKGFELYGPHPTPLRLSLLDLLLFVNVLIISRLQRQEGIILHPKQFPKHTMFLCHSRVTLSCLPRALVPRLFISVLTHPFSLKCHHLQNPFLTPYYQARCPSHLLSQHQTVILCFCVLITLYDSTALQLTSYLSRLLRTILYPVVIFIVHRTVFLTYTRCSDIHGVEST